MEKFVKPGIYKHYKGRESFVLSTSKHSETGELEVVYIGLDDKTLHVRPLESFVDEILNANGEKVAKRFEYVREVGQKELELLNETIINSQFQEEKQR